MLISKTGELFIACNNLKPISCTNLLLHSNLFYISSKLKPDSSKCFYKHYIRTTILILNSLRSLQHSSFRKLESCYLQDSVQVCPFTFMPYSCKAKKAYQHIKKDLRLLKVYQNRYCTWKRTKTVHRRKLILVHHLSWHQKFKMQTTAYKGGFRFCTTFQNF